MREQQRGFDEVMIVNPSEPGNANEGVRVMRFQSGPMGYYAEPPEMGGYGEAPDYGYYAEPPEMGWYGQAPDYGYYAEPPEMGWYGQAPDYGYYAEPEFAGYGEPDPLGYYGEDPNIAYAEEMPVAGYAESPDMAGWGESDLAAYVRDSASPFNAGCPMPTNVAHFGEPPDLSGYTSPGTVNPTVTNFTPQPGPTPNMPENLKPLW